MSFCHASQDFGVGEGDFKVKKSSFQQDKEILLEILNQNRGQETKYHPKYNFFAQKIVNYLDSQGVDSILVSKQLKEYEDAKTLSLPQIIWMSFQASILLTPEDQRDRGIKVGAGIHERVKGLLSIEMGRPRWTYPFFQDTTDSFPLSFEISKALSYFSLLPLVGTGVFTAEDFLDFYKDGIYPISLCSKGSVHGGIFKTPFEIILHDWLHLQQHIRPHVGSTPMKKAWGESYQRLVKEALLCVETNQQLLETDKKKITTALFFCIHEVDYVLGCFGQPALSQEKNNGNQGTAPTRGRGRGRDNGGRGAGPGRGEKESAIIIGKEESLEAIFGEARKYVSNHYNPLFDSKESFYIEKFNPKPREGLILSFESPMNPRFSHETIVKFMDQKGNSEEVLYSRKDNYEFHKLFFRDTAYLLSQGGGGRNQKENWGSTTKFLRYRKS